MGPLHPLGTSSQVLPHWGQHGLNCLPHLMLHLVCFIRLWKTCISSGYSFLLHTLKLGAIAAGKEGAATPI